MNLRKSKEGELPEKCRIGTIQQEKVRDGKGQPNGEEAFGVDMR